MLTMGLRVFFFTGAEQIPPTGYGAQIESPCIDFNHVATYHMASTCAIRLTLPICTTTSNFLFLKNNGYCHDMSWRIWPNLVICLLFVYSHMHTIYIYIQCEKMT